MGRYIAGEEWEWVCGLCGELLPSSAYYVSDGAASRISFPCQSCQRRVWELCDCADLNGEELWKDVYGFGSKVSHLGRVWTKRGNKVYYPKVSSESRYPGSGSIGSVHRKVALHFYGEPPRWANEVNHKDRNKHNNDVRNLEWVRQRDNHRHARCVRPLLIKMPLERTEPS